MSDRDCQLVYPTHVFPTFLRNKLIKPALRHVAQYFANSLQREELLLHFEDAFAGMVAVIEYCSFVRNDASIVESAYGLARVSISEDGSPKSTTWKQKALSIVMRMILPRIAERIRDWAEQPSQTDNSSQSNLQREGSARWQDLLQSQIIKAVDGVKRAVSAAYPYAQLGCDLSILVFQLLYVCNRSIYHHPVFALLGMQLMRRKHLPAQSNTEVPVGTPTGSTPTSSAGVNWPVATVLASFSPSAQPNTCTITATTWRAITCLGAWQRRNRHHHRRRPRRSDEAVRYHQLTPPCVHCVAEASQSLCEQQRYVLCYMCLLPYVRQNGTCPISGQRCGEGDLIRLYEDSSGTVG